MSNAVKQESSVLAEDVFVLFQRSLTSEFLALGKLGGKDSVLRDGLPCGTLRHCFHADSLVKSS